MMTTMIVDEGDGTMTGYFLLNEKENETLDSLYFQWVSCSEGFFIKILLFGYWLLWLKSDQQTSRYQHHSHVDSPYSFILKAIKIQHSNLEKNITSPSTKILSVHQRRTCQHNLFNKYKEKTKTKLKNIKGNLSLLISQDFL